MVPVKPYPDLHLNHQYNFKFKEVARAFIKKYNIENKFCYTTIASVRHLDEDRFEIVRRMENVMSPKPVFESIIFDRKQRCV